MLILNHKHDSLFDTTNSIMRIVYSPKSEKYVVLGVNNGFGSVKISAHDTEEDAKKALTIIQYATECCLRTYDFSDDVLADLDLAISALKKLMEKCI